MIEIPKHKPPSRIRYEKSHPTISFRLDRELKERLEKELEGKSFADFVKEGLGVREREKETSEEAYRKGYKKGYVVGHDEAGKKFCIYAKCAICDRTMVITEPDLKEEISKYIEEQRWRHKDCME